MFASFPYWYASLFSGYYLILFTILFGLIIRGVSFEFRHNMPEGKRRRMWNWTLSIGSFLVPFFFGILFISLVQGMPLDANGNMHAQFTDYFNLFSIVGGVALTLLCYLHGMNYIALKQKAQFANVLKLCRNLIRRFICRFSCFCSVDVLQNGLYEKNFAVTLILTLAIVVLTVIANVGVFKRKEMLAFLASGLTLVVLVALLFSGLFPRVMIGSEGFDLLIKDATSTPYTLKIMTWISLSILPFVLAYTAWSYYIFRKRISQTAVPEGY